MLDSGAFSAFTQGKPVSLIEYTDFALKNQEVIDTTVNLDMINPQNPEKAAADGWDNFMYMKDKGVHVMPVYHARENLSWLDKMLTVTDYVGLSATSLVSPVEGRSFLDLCWHYVTDNSGFPIAKFHAFGDTAPFSLLSYPWYSADSATWMIQAGRAGSVKLQGKSYRLRSKTVSDTNYISNDDAPPQKAAWQNELRTLGLDPDAVMSVTTTASQLAMIRSFLVASDIIALQERSRLVTRFKKPPALVINKRQETGGTERVGPVQINFVISPSACFMNFPVIAILGIQNILVSYFYVAREKPKFWEERMKPFLYDPTGFCLTDPKMRIFYEKIQEVLLKKEMTVVV
jgi:hypothetical protein